MKTKLTNLALFCGLALTALSSRTLAQSFSAKELTRRAIERRAVEAMIWGMPAVNFDLMLQALIRDAKAGAGSNKIIYWSKLSDWSSCNNSRSPG